MTEICLNRVDSDISDTSKRVGDPDHIKVFANPVVAETWLEENDPEGVAFE
jgi:hypothetical protein